MKKKKLCDLFYNNGLIVEAKNGQNFSDIDINFIKKEFIKKGCILFRNFNFKPENYKKFTDLFSLNYANDTNDLTRRKKTKYNKYIRDVDAGNLKMSLHSEASFSPSWPDLVWFYCEEPAIKLGETTLCDGIALWDDLKENTKSFFLSNPLLFKLKIPVVKINKKLGKKKWFINSIGTFNVFINYKTGNFHANQIRFAVNEAKIQNKLCFANHVLHRKPYIDKSIEKWGTLNGKRVPKKILEEIDEKGEKLTYYHKWMKNDLLMIDNKRFMHARNKFAFNEKRKIFNTQTLKSNINYV
tara:strand:- start:334 stop:1227 length:894 start_codon:yes stop_codon:yes gene_type:complete